MSLTNGGHLGLFENSEARARQQINVAWLKLQISMLPQPSTRPAGSVMRALNDLSESDSNARNAMPPPSITSTNGVKRQGSNLPEPAQKRKTLIERAAESVRPTSGISRPASAAGQNVSSTSLYRSSSNVSSISRTGSISSRNTSNSSYTGSLSSGIRPPTSLKSGTSTGRPKSSYGSNKPSGAASRPVSIADLQAAHEANANKSKQMSLPKLRGPRSMIDPSWNSMPPPARPRRVSNSGQSNARRIPSVVIQMRDKNRDISLSAQLDRLHIGDSILEPYEPPQTPTKCQSPSRIPKASPVPFATPTIKDTPRLKRKSPMKMRNFLTPHTNIELPDPDERYNDFKKMFEDYKQMYQDTQIKIDSAREDTNHYREKMTQLEQERSSQTESIITLKAENSTLQYQVESTEKSMQDSNRQYQQRLEEIRQAHRVDLDILRQEQREEVEKLKNDHKEEIRELKQKYQEELDQERSKKNEALSQVSTQGALEKQRHQTDLDRKDQEIAAANLDLKRVESMLERERQMNNDLRDSLKTAGDNASRTESTRQGLQAKVAYLESDSKSQSEAYAAMEKCMNEAIVKSEAIEEKLRTEEALRRRLHNQVQELKGNIRVFCRVRPTLSAEEELTRMKFPDPEESTEIEVRGLDEKNAMGKDVTKTLPFAFDRVFDPSQTNDHVYHEISQLIQSALDGYNVCIFAYGQTGSGKTYTMSSEDGMIPRALRQIYSTSKDLEDRGWRYKMEGSFVEVYNEELRDLLAEEKSTKKLEIHHDMENEETTITNATTLSLDNNEQVESILAQAMARRSVAATKANEHSSRSHSVFILKLVGKNSVTGKESKGTLNLIDLAGSERIKNAETSGQRLKETQSINRSLSSLGDVIGALGQGPATGPETRLSLNNTRESLSVAYIPYRNSKLTYLLQMSLGGNCKTLMFVMVAPEKKCLGETITSLKFAEKVSRTRVGVAKKVK
ncbi:kinesin-like nuclear fusion protein [Lithohypha guttulata]|uniref:Kinesin-like protein n=1 Tax=Lithohypha guttulata TaxID=1690604 RepID=A0ABR0JWY6_9EURO|nr:kinesin-like nuclear fusion protein [Lithohypha guttulata]